jgi:ABC-type dipeptide/oligopeptide/nickel transport system permease component
VLSYTLQRLLSTLPVVIGVIVLVSLLAHIVPGDPAELILGELARSEDIEALRVSLGLNQPIYLQIVGYFANLFQGDLGDSLILRRSVVELILERFPATIELAMWAMGVAILMAIPLGMLAAVFRGGWIDFIAMFFALVGVAMPNFWLGSVLILFFSLQLDLLPVSGRDQWTSFILPAITLGTAFAAVLSRMTRNSMLDVLSEDYIRTARAKGCSKTQVLFNHALRNAALPLVTVIGLQFGVILTGAVITEVIFDWPGLGSLMLDAVKSRDYPLIQGCVLFFSMTYVFVNLLTDFIYAWIDPRIKLQS